MTFTYNEANQILTMTQGNVRTFTYDNNGNLTLEKPPLVSGFPTSLAYDLENRLVSVVCPGVRSTYIDDGDGLRRSAIKLAGMLTTFIWDDYLMEKT